MQLSKKCLCFEHSPDENQDPDPAGVGAHPFSCAGPREVEGKLQTVYFVDKLHKKTWHSTEWIVLSALTLLKTQVVMGIVALIITALLDN